MVVALVGCGAAADPSSSATSTSSAARDSAFARAMAGPISSWRSSFQTGQMTFEVPGTVLGSSLRNGPVELLASDDAVIGGRPAQVDDAFHIGSMTKLFTA